jgi:hypothetical protein
MRPLGNRLAGVIFTTAFASVALGSASAQLSSEQQSALRANCRSDFMSKCSGVKPGGKEALTCLQTNVASLSAGCKAVVSGTLPKAAPAAVVAPHSEAAPPPAAAPAAAVTAAPAPAAPAPAQVTTAPPPPPAAPQAAVAPAPPPAPAAPRKPAVAAPKPAVAVAPAPMQPTPAQQSAMRSACRSDFMSHCSGVAPGGREALACLQRNVRVLSPSCRNVVSATLAAPKPAAAVAVAPPPPAAVAPPPVAATPEQLSAVKFTCGRDFKRYCNGIPPGGPEALGCLQRNAPRLTPNCKTALADIADQMPPAPTAVAVPPPAVAPAAPPRPSAVNAVVMLRACKLDLLRHCRGIEPGGGRELACLAAHEHSLTVRCKMARGVTAPLR